MVNTTQPFWININNLCLMTTRLGAISNSFQEVVDMFRSITFHGRLWLNCNCLDQTEIARETDTAAPSERGQALHKHPSNTETGRVRLQVIAYYCREQLLQLIQPGMSRGSEEADIIRLLLPCYYPWGLPRWGQLPSELGVSPHKFNRKWHCFNLNHTYVG